MYKADICRSAYLYLYGGYYFDVDVLGEKLHNSLLRLTFMLLLLLTTRSINQIIPVLRPYVAPEPANFITIKGDGWPDNGFFQAFLAASKRHAVLRKSIDIMVEMLWGNNRYYLGPMSLMRAWLNVTDANDDDTHLLAEVNMDVHQSIQQYPKLNNLLSTSRDEMVQNVPKEFVNRCQFSSGACNVVVLDEKDETIYFYSRLIGTTWCGRQMECTESIDHISTKTKVASHTQQDVVDSLNGAGNTMKDHTVSQFSAGQANLSSNQLDSQSSSIAEDMFDKFEDALQDQHISITPQPPPQDTWLISSSESTQQQIDRIPKIINRIYFAKDGNYPEVVSDAIKQAHKTWFDNNPGYQVRYFNLIKARRYLHKHFHPVFLRAFDCIEAFAGKSDLFRMALLYREGGFHADWKTVCLEKNLLERISNDIDFFVTKGFFAALDYGVSGVCSRRMMVYSGHSYFITGCLHRVDLSRNQLSIFTCGPFLQ